jgi:hypothetical protein
MWTYRYSFRSPAHYYVVDVTASDMERASVMADGDRRLLEGLEARMADAIGEAYTGYSLRGVEISPAQHDDVGVVLVDSGANG